MALKVIGTGFGRTGTNSLKLALELLGFGPCHHMYELRDNPEQLPLWRQAAFGEGIDWDVVFENYSSCVDWPAAFYWRELCAKYPEAKVLHSVRDEEKWIDSIYKTTYPVMCDWNQKPPGITRDRQEMSHEIVANRTFNGRMADRNHAIKVFRAHNEEVRRTISANKLLVYDIKQGWEQLCYFLDVPIPDTEFSRVNSTAEFHKNK